MRVFITGGTGFVGNSIVDQCCQLGHQVTLALRRRPSSDLESRLRRRGIQTCEGELGAADVLAGSLSGHDAIIHLVGIIAATRSNSFEQAHVRTTQLMLDAARRSGVKRYVHMSALGSREQAASRYHQTKWQAEVLVRQSGLDYTIFRPSIIFGPQDEFVNQLALMARYSPILPVLGSGAGRMQPIAVEDVARCFVRSLTTDKSLGRTYDLCGPDAFSLEEILEVICDVTGRRRWMLRVPWLMAFAGAWLGETMLAKGLNVRPPLTRDQLIMLDEDNRGDPKSAREDFQLEMIPFREGIRRYLRPRSAVG
jgi:uncharacterized protein YbjT (DUF2867 family)